MSECENCGVDFYVVESGLEGLCPVCEEEADENEGERMSDVTWWVYMNKRTGELRIEYSGMCAWTYELLGEL